MTCVRSLIPFVRSFVEVEATEDRCPLLPPLEARVPALPHTAVMPHAESHPETTCRFPGCEAPVTPPPPTGGRSYYCMDVGHEPAAAFRARRRARDAAQPTDRPATTGGERLRVVAERLQMALEAHVGDLTGLIDDGLTALRDVVDPSGVELELDAVRAEAQRAVGEANARATAAELAQLVAEQEATTSLAGRVTAETSTAAAIRRAEESQEAAAEAIAAATAATEEATSARHASAVAAARDAALLAADEALLGRAELERLLGEVRAKLAQAEARITTAQEERARVAAEAVAAAEHAAAASAEAASIRTQAEAAHRERDLASAEAAHARELAELHRGHAEEAVGLRTAAEHRSETISLQLRDAIERAAVAERLRGAEHRAEALSVQLRAAQRAGAEDVPSSRRASAPKTRKRPAPG